MWARGTARNVAAARAAARRVFAEPADLDRLEAVFARSIARACREAATRLPEVVAAIDEGRAVAAAANPEPKWNLPAPFNLRVLDEASAAASVEAQRVWVDRARRVVTETGLVWDVSNPLAEGAAVQFGTQIVGASESARLAIMSVIDRAWSDGLSIPDTARLLRDSAEEMGIVRATRIARTELAGIVNGANLAGVLLANAAAAKYGEDALFSHKQWLATLDGRTRPTHVAANGQKVPVGATFLVGGYSLNYPGDPNGPAEEVVNCRCTTTWED